MHPAVTATAGPDEELAERLDEAADKMGITGEEGPRRGGARWAMMIARIYETFPLLCPRCSAPMTEWGVDAGDGDVDDLDQTCWP